MTPDLCDRCHQPLDEDFHEISMSEWICGSCAELRAASIAKDKEIEDMQREDEGVNGNG